ncbi:12261_t:CDS:2, partial [Funneliformis caledonium]
MGRENRLRGARSGKICNELIFLLNERMKVLDEESETHSYGRPLSYYPVKKFRRKRPSMIVKVSPNQC